VAAPGLAEKPEWAGGGQGAVRARGRPQSFRREHARPTCAANYDRNSAAATAPGLARSTTASCRPGRPKNWLWGALAAGSRGLRVPPALVVRIGVPPVRPTNRSRRLRHPDDRGRHQDRADASHTSETGVNINRRPRFTGLADSNALRRYFVRLLFLKSQAAARLESAIALAEMTVIRRPGDARRAAPRFAHVAHVVCANRPVGRQVRRSRFMSRPSPAQLPIPGRSKFAPVTRSSRTSPRNSAWSAGTPAASLLRSARSLRRSACRCADRCNRRECRCNRFASFRRGRAGFSASDFVRGKVAVQLCAIPASSRTSFCSSARSFAIYRAGRRDLGIVLAHSARSSDFAHVTPYSWCRRESRPAPPLDRRPVRLIYKRGSCCSSSSSWPRSFAAQVRRSGA